MTGRITLQDLDKTNLLLDGKTGISQGNRISIIKVKMRP